MYRRVSVSRVRLPSANCASCFRDKAGNDEPVGDVDAELVAAQAPGRVARQAGGGQAELPPLAEGVLKAAPRHAAVDESFAFPHRVDADGDGGTSALGQSENLWRRENAVVTVASRYGILSR